MRPDDLLVSGLGLFQNDELSLGCGWTWWKHQQPDVDVSQIKKDDPDLAAILVDWVWVLESADRGGQKEQKKKVNREAREAAAAAAAVDDEQEGEAGS